MLKCFRLGKMLPKLRLPVRIGILIVFVLTLLIYSRMSKNKRRHPTLKASFEQAMSERWQKRQNNKKYLVNDENCDILEMNPWDSSVLEFMEKPDIEIEPCPEKIVTVSTKDKMFRYSESAYVAPCSFRYIHRITQDLQNYTDAADRQIRKSAFQIIPKSSEPETKAKFQFLEINCPLSKHDQNKSRTHYEAIVIPPTEQSIQTAAKAQFWKNPQSATTSVYDGNGSDTKLKTEQNLNLPPSVLIIGLNSVSRLHMIRSMPQTHKFLSDNQFVEMLGYTKIHQDAFGNLLTVLLGADPQEQTCWVDTLHKHDNCPFIWKEFSRRNYVTALLEDVAENGVFNNGKTGFVEQPTDYYFRPMALGYGKQLDGQNQKCALDGGETQFLQKYIKNFVTEMSEKVPYFLMSWFSSMNSEKINFLQTLDSTFLEFITETLKTTRNNTILIFMSDHGQKYGKFRETFLGYYEDALPTFFIRLPTSLQRSQPSWYLNLIDNSGRLTSPINLHATLQDVLSLSKLPDKPLLGQHDTSGDSKLSLFSPVNPISPKVYSLFEELPQNLSCDSGGIPPESCRCNVHPDKGRSSHIAKEFALVVLQKINRIIENEIDEKKCAQLKLSQVLYVHQVWEGMTEVSFWTEKLHYNDFIIGLEVVPSRVRYETKIHALQLFKFKIMGMVAPISKNNGLRNKCVKDPLKKLYCFCI